MDSICNAKSPMSLTKKEAIILKLSPPNILSIFSSVVSLEF